jgi:hypothetical protein
MTQLSLTSNLCLYRLAQEILVYVPATKGTYLLSGDNYLLFNQLAYLSEMPISIEASFALCAQKLSINRQDFQRSIDDLLSADLVIMS